MSQECFYHSYNSYFRKYGSVNMYQLLHNFHSCYLLLLQIYKDNELYYYIDGFDTSKANWMRYVNPAYSSDSQNLIACQYKMNIYFYTIKPILPNQELLVWYCREFAERLNYPLTGEQMLQRISK